MANATSLNVAATDLGLVDVLRHRAPDGSYASAIDVLSGKFPLLEQLPWVQANDDTAHEFLRVTSEPTGSMVRYNEGTAVEAAAEMSVREQLGRMESILKIDTRILEKSADPVRYRREKEAAHVRGMIKQWTKIMFATRDYDGSAYTYYGDMGKDPKSINGLGTRYKKLTTVSSPVDNVRQMASPGAVANVQSSIWLVKFAADTGMFGIHPKTAGRTFRIEDLKEQVVYDSAGRPYTAVMTRFSFEFGLGIGDERCAQRLCNIATAAGATTGSFDNDTDKEQGEKALIEMIERLPGGDTDGAVFFAGPAIMTALRKRLNSKSNLFFTEQTVWGRPMITFNGIPFVRNDALVPFEPILS